MAAELNVPRPVLDRAGVPLVDAQSPVSLRGLRWR